MTHHDIIKEAELVRAGFAAQIKTLEEQRTRELAVVQGKCKELGHIFSRSGWIDGDKCCICDARKQ